MVSQGVRGKLGAILGTDIVIIVKLFNDTIEPKLFISDFSDCDYDHT